MQKIPYVNAKKANLDNNSPQKMKCCKIQYELVILAPP